MASLLRTLARTGLRRGLLEGRRPWLMIGLTATGLRIVARVMARKPQVVYSEKLSPGERIVIRALPPEAG
ncbi:MAG: hypothetical protein JOZ99_03245 [Actinobacteria bacterium]|nr:hypothetical protein [Actinomycetota bacterium]